MVGLTYRVGRGVLAEPRRLTQRVRPTMRFTRKVGRGVPPSRGGSPRTARPTKRLIRRVRPTCLQSGHRIECNPIGPFVLHAYQPLADWILTNVMPFFGKLALIPDAVLKAIALKANAYRFPQKPFPCSTSRLAVSGRESRKHVQMIRHDQEKVQKPSSMFVVESRCGEYLFGNFKKRRSASLRRIDRHKLDNGTLNRKRRQPVRKLPPYR